MAENVLKGVIQVTAPGVKQVFTDVAGSASLVQKALAEMAAAGGVSIGALESSLKDFEVRLKAATDPRDIAKLSGAIQGLKQKIAELKGLGAGSFDKLKSSANSANLALINTGRVIQDLPFGFLGIANNLNPLLESFQRLKAETGSSTTAFKSLLSSLGGAGGLGFALSLVSSALLVFGDALFGSKKRAEENKAALDALAASIENVKQQTEELTTALQLANKIGSINVKIRGQDNLQDLREQSVANRQFIVDLEKETNLAKQNLRKADLLDQKKSSDKSKELVQSAASAVREAQKKEEAARNEQRTIFRQIALQQVEDAKDAAKKLDDLNKKLVKDTIAEGKRLVSEFSKGNIRLTILPTFSEIDTEDEQLKKAREAIKKVNDFFKNFSSNQRALNLFIPFEAIPIVAPPDRIRLDDFLKETKEGLRSILEGFKLDGVEAQVPVDVQLIAKAVTFEKDTAFKKQLDAALAGTFGIKINVEGLSKAEQALVDIQNQSIFTAETISGLLTPAFQNLFQAILDGEDPLKSFFEGLGQAVAQLIQKLIAAAVEALILAAIFGSIGGAEGFGAIFAKLLGFAEGGRPPVGKPSVVGERGPEVWKPDLGKPSLVGVGGPTLFKPDRPGVIIANHKMGQAVASMTDKRFVSTNTAKEQVVIRDISKEIYQALQSIVTTIVKQSESVLRSVFEYRSSTSSEKVDRDSKDSVTKEHTQKVDRNKESKDTSGYESIARIKQLSSAIDRITKTYSDKEVNNLSTALTSVIKTVEKVKETDHFKEVSGERVTSKTDNKLILKELIGGINSTVSREKSEGKTTIKKSDSAFVYLVEKGYTSFSDTAKLIKESFTNATNDSSQFVYADSQKEIKTSVSALVDSIREYESILSKFVSSKTSTKDHSDSTSDRLIKLVYDRERSTHSILKTTAKELSRFVSTNKNTYVDKSLSSVIKSFTHTIGFRAKGGPVDWTKPFIVGERGPEIFEPKRSGRIVPNHKITRNVFNQVRNNNRSVTGSNKNVFSNSSAGNKSFSNRHKEEKNFFYNLSRTDNSMRSLSSITNKPFAGFRSNGGNAVAGTSLIVGGGGVELFIPNTGQSIVNNNNTSNGSSVSGGTLNVKGRIEISGRNLVAVLENEKRSQRQLS